MSANSIYSKEQLDFINEKFKGGLTYKEIAELFSKKFQREVSAKAIKSARLRYGIDLPSNSETREDGTYATSRMVEVPTGANYSSEQLITIAGLDPEEFDISPLPFGFTKGVSGNKEDGFKVTNWLKLKFVKKSFSLNKSLIEEVLKLKPKTYIYDRNKIVSKKCLEINLADLHFGFNSIEYYLPYQNELLELINEGFDKIVITTGGDMLHCDNTHGTTHNGTLVGSKEMFINGYQWALDFVEPLIETSLSKANNVEIIYIEGNHDSDSSWLMAKAWEKKYPQAKHNTERENWKYFKYGKNFIGLTHGANGKYKNFDRVFMALFRNEILGCENIEIHSQDKHYEKANNQYGITVRILSSPSQMTDWIKKNGYVGNRKAIECFVYSEKRLKKHILIEPDEVNN